MDIRISGRNVKRLLVLLVISSAVACGVEETGVAAPPTPVTKESGTEQVREHANTDLVPPAPPTPPPTPTQGPHYPYNTPTAEEEARGAARWEEFKKTWVWASGPTTMGATLQIANQTVKLPDDSYIKDYVAIADCIIGGPPCPESPFYVIARGKSEILITARNGLIWSETVATGEERAFDFLSKFPRRVQ